MTAAATSPSPFDLLLNPEAVLAAIHNSERLNRLNSRVCRPLDRPAPGTTGATAPGLSDLEAIAESGIEGLQGH
jgi:hypothetical protein